MQNRKGFSRQTAYARFYRHARSLPRLGRPASSTTTARQMAATSCVQKTKTNWTFRNLECSFMPKIQPPEWHGKNHSLPPYSSTLIHVSCHLYVASNELRSAGERSEFRFPNGLLLLQEHMYDVGLKVPPRTMLPSGEYGAIFTSLPRRLV